MKYHCDCGFVFISARGARCLLVLLLGRQKLVVSLTDLYDRLARKWRKFKRVAVLVHSLQGGRLESFVHGSGPSLHQSGPLRGYHCELL